MRLFAMLAMLAACGGRPSVRSVDDEMPVGDAKATPPVPPLDRSADPAELRERLAATEDARERLILLGLLVEAEWAASCPDATDGLCSVRVPRAAGAPTTCDAHTHEVVASARAEDRIVEVLGLAGEVRHQWAGVDVINVISDPPTDDELDAYVQNTHVAEEVAAALLIMAHVDVEALLSVPRVTGLDMSSPAKEASIKGAKIWRDAMQLHTAAALDGYALVAGDPLLLRWAPGAVVEALARMGIVRMRWVQEFSGLEHPNGIAGNPDLEQAFCDAIRHETGPLASTAAETFARCVELARETGVTGAWADRCASELAALRPSP